ncbi:MAG: uroporphyrinogen decarboxylase family protein [Candidatus Latescibacterota bacterium]
MRYELGDSSKAPTFGCVCIIRIARCRGFHGISAKKERPRLTREQTACAGSASLAQNRSYPQVIGVPLHVAFLEKLTGLDPYEHPKEASLQAIEQLDLDVAGYFEVVTRPRLTGAETREVAEGRKAAFFDVGINGGEGETLWKIEAARSFDTVEDVYNFDVETHPLCRTTDEFEAELREQFSKTEEHRAILGKRAVTEDPVDWYNTVFMWGVTTFGWALFLETAALDPKRYAHLLDRFTDVTRRYFVAAARLDGPVAGQAHDDLCITRGPVFHPDWYRKYIFPLYPKVLEPVRARGLKMIYRGDGNVDEFIDDLAAAGFDGFIVRSETNLARIAEKYGKNKVIIGNISTAILTFGDKHEIYEDVERCAQQAGHCPGYFFHVAGEIPGNVPVESIFYTL